jgi:hypothetical protein
VGDYRLLGLSWGESDIVKIRNSVTASSNDLRKKVKPRGVHEALDRRTKVALAGYRLLDPRFRRQLYDRVQLSYIIYRELDELPCDSESSARLPLLADEPLNSGEQFESTSLSIISSLDPEGSSLEEAREIVRMLNAPKHARHPKATKVSRWIRLARSLGSFCRRVRCAVL